VLVVALLVPQQQAQLEQPLAACGNAIFSNLSDLHKGL
jgi:hypothetical protein